MVNEDKISLVDIITNILISKGHPRPYEWTQHEYIQIAKNATPDFERIYVNRYWRQYLGTLNCSTSMERYCLDDHVNNNTYVNNFRDVVSLVIIQNL